MILVEEAVANKAYNLMKPTGQGSGGSASNTIFGIASLGGHPAFSGKVADDDLGRIYVDDARKGGVTFQAPQLKGGVGTGRCMVFVTPDAQRTMIVYLGAANTFGPADIQPDCAKNAQITYLEGYLFDNAPTQEAFRQTARIAHEAGKKVAMTLSDSFCIERHRDAFDAFLRSGVDILFCNEAELSALYKAPTLQESIAVAQKICPLVIATRGAQGVTVASKDGMFDAPATPVLKVIDTTGAGDLFAAGFLFGLTHGKELKECARIGAVAAAEIISHFGSRPQVALKTLI